MNILQETLMKKEKSFIGYLTAGDPSLDKLESMLHALEDGGCDAIEIGVAFSDPLADGPVIQEAGMRAINRGTNIQKIFNELERIDGEIKVPLVFLIYYNTIFRYGLEKFVRKCEDVGIAGLIIPDLPLEEQEDILQYINQEKLAIIPFATPTSKGRMAKTLNAGSGFVYTVSSLGVTGRKSEFYSDIKQYMRDVRKAANIPVAIGFGISNHEDVEKIWTMADAAIVGSAIVTKIYETGADYNKVKGYIEYLIKG